MSKLVRNTSDPESRAFWEGVDKVAGEIKGAPSWMRAGITVNAQHFETYAPRASESLTADEAVTRTHDE